MKCRIPEISWHNREPILSIDIQPVENDFYRLATGGSDYHVLVKLELFSVLPYYECVIFRYGNVKLLIMVLFR